MGEHLGREAHHVGHLRDIRLTLVEQTLPSFHLDDADKLLNQLLHFDSIKDFLSYTGHSLTNGSLSHVRDKIWFKERFEII